MLIVLDRSGSMKNGNVNRWDPSVMALKMITSSFGASVNFGLLAFPGKASTPPPMPTQDCSTITDLVAQIACIATEAAGGVARADTCVAGSVEVPIGANNGMAIGAALDRMAPEGATPTAVSLKAAHDAIGSGMTVLDDAPKAKYVLLVTDGAPNCSNTGSTGGRGFDNQAVDQSVAEITAMAKDGVKTFVIGYNTKSDAQLSAALDRMAQAGGTGDKQHHAIEDGNSLLTEFQKIAGAAASCELVLNMVPANPSFVQVKLDDQQINLNDPNGWTISADRRRVTLQGNACSAVAGKEHHQVSVRVLCEPVVLQ
jgi:Mg-chelatase subunit ChlD